MAGADGSDPGRRRGLLGADPGCNAWDVRAGRWPPITPSRRRFRDVYRGTVYALSWPGQVGNIYGPHSIYFQVLAEHGYVGLALYLLLVLSCLCDHCARCGRSAAPRDDNDVGQYAHMFRVSLVGFLISGLFLGRAYFDYFFAIVACLIILDRVAKDRWAAAAAASWPGLRRRPSLPRAVPCRDREVRLPVHGVIVCRAMQRPIRVLHVFHHIFPTTPCGYRTRSENILRYQREHGIDVRSLRPAIMKDRATLPDPAGVSVQPRPTYRVAAARAFVNGG